MPCSSRIMSKTLPKIHSMEKFNFIKFIIYSEIIEFSSSSGTGSAVLAASVGWGCFAYFCLTYPIFHLSPSLLETARYKPKYYLKQPLKPPKQQINQNIQGPFAKQRRAYAMPFVCVRVRV